MRAAVHAALGDAHRLAMVDELERGDRRPSELARLVDVPMNLLAHHLKVLEGAGLVERRRSEGDRRKRYVVLRRTALAQIGIARPDLDGRLAFVCTHNSARSQYAAAYARSLGIEATSAGLAPASRVHPMAVDVAAERGIDLSDAHPRGYQELAYDIDLVISVCDRAGEDDLPAAAEHRHWSVPDPVARGSVDAFRAAFDDLERRMAAWAT